MARPVEEKLMDISNSHSLSTLILPKNAASLDDAIYMRLEGFYFSIINPNNGEVKVTYYFNLDSDA